MFFNVMLHRIKRFFPFILMLLIVVSIILINYGNEKVVKSQDLIPLVSYQKNFNNLAVLLVFNGEHYIEAENLLASIKKNAPELLPYLTICVSDSNGKDFAIRHHLQWFEMSAIKKSGGFLSYAMNVMTRRKLEAIIYLLQNKKDVLYIDTDIVILKNPLPELKTQYDLNIQDDLCVPSFDLVNVCTGFMYIKHNPKTIKFFQRAINEQVKRNYNKFNDQHAVNLLLEQQHDITVHVLDACKFPNGCRYFPNNYSFECKACDHELAVIVHNNYRTGIREKMQRFKENNLIF